MTVIHTMCELLIHALNIKDSREWVVNSLATSVDDTTGCGNSFRYCRRRVAAVGGQAAASKSASPLLSNAALNLSASLGLPPERRNTAAL